MTKEKKLNSQNGFRAFFTLVKMQLKDQLDISWVKSVKSIIRTVILTLLKAIIVGALAFGILYILFFLGIYRVWNIYQIVIVIVGFSLFLSLVSCTLGLTNSLYFADDNKVLITMPVSTNKLFISKIIVYYISELKRSITFLMPIVISCCIMLMINNKISWLVFLWMWIPLIFIVGIPVLFGALLSIPFMGIKIVLNKVPVLKVILTIIAVLIGVSGVVGLILIIPNNIDFNNQIIMISNALSKFLILVENVLIFEKQLVYLLIGDLKANSVYGFSWFIPLRFISLIAILGILFMLNYFISRPLFLSMMSKTIERNASLTKSTSNKKHGKFTTFILKELKINFRSMNVSGTLIAMYIIIPIVVLLLNEIFVAMDKSQLGNRLATVFNILLIVLLYLSTNSIVASLYSKEGRAGYIKRTKPVQAKYPLLAKMALNVILSIPSIIVTVIIFGIYNLYLKYDLVNIMQLYFKLDLTKYLSAELIPMFNTIFSIIVISINILIMIVAIMALHFGHMLYSATLDITNPKNEQYATTGEGTSNPNEDKSTIFAFAISIVFALLSFVLISESLLRNMYTIACLKLLLIGVGVLVLFGILFFKNIKAYYYEG